MNCLDVADAAGLEAGKLAARRFPWPLMIVFA